MEDASRTRASEASSCCSFLGMINATLNTVVPGGFLELSSGAVEYKDEESTVRISGTPHFGKQCCLAQVKNAKGGSGVA